MPQLGSAGFKEMQTKYQIKRSLTIPLVLATLLFFLLIVITYINKTSLQEKLILSIGFIPLLLVSIELMEREIQTDEKGISIKKFLKKKNLLWDDITHVGLLTVNKKIYLLLTTTKGFHIISNAYGDFTSIVKNILNRIDKDRIEEGVFRLVDYPVKRMSDIVLSWVAVVVLAGIIFNKLFG